MKRFIVSLMVVAGALLSACTEEDESIQSVGLSGTYDVTQVGDLLFVTSADNDELRVLQLAVEETQRRFLLAPNPLEALSIPVLERPQALARDVRYDANGVEQSGSYVYARSSGSTQISVVAADRSRLREVVRLDTKALTQGQPAANVSSGPVTAFAARAAELAEGEKEENRGSTLYYATQEVTGARLWQVQLPGPAQFDAQALRVEPVGDASLLANVAVTSLLVLPQPGMIAVSTRSPAGGASLGKSYTLNVGTLERRELKFGAQVLQLATHGRASYRNPQNVDEKLTLEEGERIFGVLDASSCGGQSQCTGVLAVDARSGEVLEDATGYPMMPINAGTGLPMGLSLSTDTKLIVQFGEPLDQPNPGSETQPTTQRDSIVPLLGIVPLSNGEILFFDGVNLAPFNVNANNVTTDNTTTTVYAPTVSKSFIRTQGATAEETGDIEVTTTYGVTRDQTYLLTYEGILPGMEVVQRQDGAFKVAYMPRGMEKGQVVQPEDRIILLSAATGGQPCANGDPSGELTVAAVLPPSGEETLATLQTSGTIPEACAGYEYFQVRAAGSKPLVLSSAGEDYIQRLGVGDEYSSTGSYFFHPPGYMGQTENVAIRLRVTGLNRGDIVRGSRYVVSTQANYFPYVITVDTVNYAGLRSFRLPGPVVQWRAWTSETAYTDYAYIVYPSASGVLEVNLNNIDATVANSRGVVPYR